MLVTFPDLKVWSKIELPINNHNKSMKKLINIGRTLMCALKWDLKMKLTAFFLLVCMLQINATTYSQKTRISLDMNDVQLSEVLNRIETISEFKFFVDTQKIDVKRAVDIKADKEKIFDILDKLFRGTNITYEVYKKQILLKKVDYKPIQSQSIGPDQSEIEINNPQQTITGTISDESGTPLPGANILEKGTTNGTQADFDGNFSIEVADNNAILVVSYIGFTTKEVSINDQSNIAVILNEDAAGLDEVVVVGYGSMKKSDLTGSVASIKGDKLLETPIISVDQGLQGKIAGVQITQGSGQPGSAPRIRIRGTNSINGGSMPLYVIDGFPIYSNGTSSMGVLLSNGGVNPLNTIDPNNIESIEVLKDASATAIYGSRASNGVIMITTKKGKVGKSQVTFNSYYGLQSIAKKMDLLNAQEFAINQNEAFARRNKALRYSQEEIDSLGLYGGTDWQDELYRSAVPIQSYSLSINGGSEKLRSALSLGYFSQDGLIINSGIERYTASLNVDHKVSDKLSVGTSISFARAASNLALTNTSGSVYGGVSYRGLIEDPTKPVYTEDGKFNYEKASLFWGGNSVADAHLMENLSLSDRFLGNIFAEWKITSNITGKAVFGINILSNEERRFSPAELFRNGGISTASIGKGKDETWLNDYTLSYHNLFDNSHDVNIVVGSSFQRNNSNVLVGTTRNLVIESLKYYSLGGGIDPSAPGSNFSDWSFGSFFGRANYKFKEKYLLTITGRYDGSSRFGENNKWGFFPSASLGWRLTQEDFVKNLNLFSNMKLRAGYGITGNSEIGLYRTQQTLAQAYYTFGDQVSLGFGPNPSNLPNPNLGWETTGQLNIGLDMGVFDNRISTTIDFYKKTTTDLLFNLTVPRSSGRSASQENLGKIENKGVDFNLSSINISRDKFKWTTSLNLSHNKNIVKDLGGNDNIILDARILKVGEPLGAFYGYIFDGIIQKGELAEAPQIAGLVNHEGYWKYKDLDGDGEITPEDRSVIGDPNPDFTGGLTNNFTFGNFELNFSLTGASGYDIYNKTKSELLSARGERNSHTDILKAWTEDNPSNEFPINGIIDTPSYSFSVRNPNSWLLEHVSYLRIQDVSIACNMPRMVLDKIGLSSAKIYISGNNLYTFTNYRYGYDPEVNSEGNSNIAVGTDYDTYPRSKSIRIGLNVSF